MGRQTDEINKYSQIKLVAQNPHMNFASRCANAHMHVYVCTDKRKNVHGYVNLCLHKCIDIYVYNNQQIHVHSTRLRTLYTNINLYHDRIHRRTHMHKHR